MTSEPKPVVGSSKLEDMKIINDTSRSTTDLASEKDSPENMEQIGQCQCPASPTTGDSGVVNVTNPGETISDERQTTPEKVSPEVPNGINQEITGVGNVDSNATTPEKECAGLGEHHCKDANSNTPTEDHTRLMARGLAGTESLGNPGVSSQGVNSHDSSSLPVLAKPLTVNSEVKTDIPQNCEHLCKSCGSIYSHRILPKLCNQAQIDECPKCLGEREAKLVKTMKNEKEVTIPEINPEFWNLTIAGKSTAEILFLLQEQIKVNHPDVFEKGINSNTSLDEVEIFISMWNKAITAIKSVPAAAGSIRRNRIDRIRDSSDELEKEEYKRLKAGRLTTTPTPKKVMSVQSKMEKEIESYVKLGFSREKAERYAKEVKGL